MARPQMGENIGSVARAIKNFNITKLRIVNPKCNWPNQKAIAISVGAKDILRVSKIYNSIEEAVADLDVVFASTSRIRKVNKKGTKERNAFGKVMKAVLGNEGFKRQFGKGKWKYPKGQAAAAVTLAGTLGAGLGAGVGSLVKKKNKKK